MDNRIKLGPFRPIDSKDAKLICIITFVGFFLTLIIGGYIENLMSGMGAPFLVLSGFLLGVSEIMYWISKALETGSRSTWHPKQS